MHSYTEKQGNPGKIRFIFYLLWFCLSLIQAVYSNLIPDETLYWSYSERLSWGYFEHAPGIAIAVKMGYSVLHSQLGVRLFSIFAMAGAIFFIERIVRPRRLILFYMAMASIAVLHILSILAVPDAPLFFFTAGFFLLYKKYLLKDKLYLAILLSLNAALLLYSKYHGILIIFFAAISNIHLLRRRSFWLIAVLSCIFFLPHIIWQYNNGFPTIVFNLFERDMHHMHGIGSVFSYLGSVPLVFVPFTGIIFLFSSFSYRVTTSFERTLKFTFGGTLIFFFLMSLRGNIEANWILCITVPVVYMGYHTLVEKKWGPKLIRISFICSLTLIIAARIILIDGLTGIDMDTTNWKKWAKEIQLQANGRPVAFMNSYQKLGEYEFYTGEKAFPVNNVMGRKDQYTLWNDEDRYQGKDIMLITNYYQDGLNSFETPKGNEQYALINNFHSSSNIEITPSVKEITVSNNNTFTISFTTSVKEGSHVDAEANAEYPMYISYQLFKDKKLYSNTITDIKLNNTLLNTKHPFHLQINSPAEKGNYTLLISVSTGWLPPSITGAQILLHNN